MLLLCVPSPRTNVQWHYGMHSMRLAFSPRLTCACPLALFPLCSRASLPNGAAGDPTATCANGSAPSDSAAVLRCYAVPPLLASDVEPRALCADPWSTAAGLAPSAAGATALLVGEFDDLSAGAATRAQVLASCACARVCASSVSAFLHLRWRLTTTHLQQAPERNVYRMHCC